MLTPKAGDRIGGFEIVRRIGAGGMGVVYLAREPGSEQMVALKVLSASMTREKTRQRFLREAESAARLDHPNIVAVRHIHSDEDFCFYTMEYIEGDPLSRVLQWLPTLREPPEAFLEILHQLDSNIQPIDSEAKTLIGDQPEPPHGVTEEDRPVDSNIARKPGYIRQIAAMMRDIARALHYAHGRGVIHRDIKPDNLLLDKQGQLHLTDFGLARIMDEESLTLTGELMGTPLYMSPEQVAAGRIGMDHRTDIYSLGVVMYQLLSLQPPYQAATREGLLRAIAVHQPIALSTRNPAIPRPLETIVQRMLAKDPDQRYANAGALADDLDRWLAGKPIHAKRVGRLGLWWSTKPIAARWAFTAALAGVLSGLILIGVHLSRHDMHHEPHVSPRDIAQAAAERGDYLQSALWYAESLTENNSDAASSSLPLSMVLHELAPLHGRYRLADTPSAFAFDPAGHMLLVGTADDQIRLIDPVLRTEQPVPTRNAGRLKWVGFNRNGSKMLTLHTHEQSDIAEFWTTDGYPLHDEPLTGLGRIVQLRLAVDTGVVVFMSATPAPTTAQTQPVSGNQEPNWYRIEVYDFTEEQPPRLLQSIRSPMPAEISGDGRYLAALASRGVLEIFDLHTGDLLRLPFLGQPVGFCFAASAASSYLAVTDLLGQITVFDVADSVPLPRLVSILRAEEAGRRQQVAPVYMEFGPDGGHLLVVGSETFGQQLSGKSIRLWNIHASPPTFFEARGHDAQLITDGQTLCFWDDNQITFVDVATKQIVNQIAASVGLPTALSTPEILTGLNARFPVSADRAAGRLVCTERIAGDHQEETLYQASVWVRNGSERMYRLLTPSADLQRTGMTADGQFAFIRLADPTRNDWLYVYDLHEQPPPGFRAEYLPSLPSFLNDPLTTDDLCVSEKPLIVTFTRQNENYVWTPIDPLDLSQTREAIASYDPSDQWRLSAHGDTLMEINWRDQARVFDFDVGQLRRSWTLPTTATRTFALSANGRLAAIPHADLRITLHNVGPSGEADIFGQIGLLTGRPALLRFNHDGSLLAIADALGRVVINHTGEFFEHVCEINTGQPIRSMLFCPPEDSILAVGHNGGHVTLWSASNGRSIGTIESPTGTDPSAPSRLTVQTQAAERGGPLLAVACGNRIHVYELPQTINHTEGTPSIATLGAPLESTHPIIALSFSRGTTEENTQNFLFAVTDHGALRWYNLTSEQASAKQWRQLIARKTGMVLDPARGPRPLVDPPFPEP
ncbi:MAG: protein kinase [Phycisphaerales bacterium]|nr:protein kinase [Phycisphaerales bacterium]